MADRKADKLAGAGSFADMMRRRRKAMEKGDIEKAHRIAQEYQEKLDRARKVKVKRRMMSR